MTMPLYQDTYHKFAISIRDTLTLKRKANNEGEERTASLSPTLEQKTVLLVTPKMTETRSIFKSIS